MARFVTLLLLLIGACASDAQQANDAESSPLSALQNFLLDPFEQPIGHSMVLSDAKEKILQRFGEPQKVDIVSIPNRYAEGDIKYSTLHYSGLAIQIAEYPGRSESWLTRIEITGEQYQLKNDLRTGVKRGNVLEWLRPTNFTESQNRLTIFENIWEERTDVRTGHVHRVDASIKLEIAFDAGDRVSRILWVYQEH